MSPQYLKVPADLANQLASYLAQCPYGEVYQLMAALSKCEPCQDQPESPTDESSD